MLEGSRIWDSAWREERARAYGIPERQAGGPLPCADDAEGERLPGRCRRGCSLLRLAEPGGQEHRATSSTSTAASRSPTRARGRRAGRPVRHLSRRHALPRGAAGCRSRARAPRPSRSSSRPSRRAAASCTRTAATTTRRQPSPSDSSGSSRASTRSSRPRRRASGWFASYRPALAPRVFELSEFLVARLGVEDVGASFPHRVTYHPTCHSLRVTQVGDAPLRLLRAVRGLELVELPEARECCGFGGTFAVKNADTSSAHARGQVPGGRSPPAPTSARQSTARA